MTYQLMSEPMGQSGSVEGKDCHTGRGTRTKPWEMSSTKRTGREKEILRKGNRRKSYGS